jgi:hypothetical protein
MKNLFRFQKNDVNDTELTRLRGENRLLREEVAQLTASNRTLHRELLRKNAENPENAENKESKESKESKSYSRRSLLSRVCSACPVRKSSTSSENNLFARYPGTELSTVSCNPSSSNPSSCNPLSRVPLHGVCEVPDASSKNQESQQSQKESSKEDKETNESKEAETKENGESQMNLTKATLKNEPVIAPATETTVKPAVESTVEGETKMCPGDWFDVPEEDFRTSVDTHFNVFLEHSRLEHSLVNYTSEFESRSRCCAPESAPEASPKASPSG